MRRVVRTHRPEREALWGVPMTHPALTRAHLEALLIARVLLDPSLAECVDDARLSPSAQRLMDAVLDTPHIAGAAGLLAATDPTDDPVANSFIVRLAKRVESLALRDVAVCSIDELVGHINRLPRLGLVSTPIVGLRRAS